MIVHDGPHGDLLRSFIARRKQLGFTQSLLDVKVGWADGYAGKVEACMRSPRLLTVCEWAEALGCRLTLKPAPPAGIGHNRPPDPQLSMVRALDAAIPSPETGSRKPVR